MDEVGVKFVEDEREFNSLIPMLVLALKDNEHEWSFEHTLEGMFELMNGNKHRLCYTGELYNPQTFGFFLVDGHSTLNKTVRLMWSWAKDTMHVDELHLAAASLAIAEGATRIQVNACKRLAKKLLEKGYTAQSIDVIKEL